MKAKGFVIFAGEGQFYVGATDGETAVVAPLTATLGSPASIASREPVATADEPADPIPQIGQDSDGFTNRHLATESPVLPRVFVDAKTNSKIGSEEAFSGHDAKDSVDQDADDREVDPWKALARAIKDELAGLGYRDQAVTLAIPSHWCLIATIPTKSLPRKSKAQAMQYRLEEQLPLAAEDFAAIFLESNDRHALGIALEIDRVKALLDALEDQGVNVDVICPEVLLTCHHMKDRPASGWVVWGGENTGHDVLRFDRNRLVSWRLAGCPTARWRFLLAPSPISATEQVPTTSGCDDQDIDCILTVNLQPEVIESIADSLKDDPRTFEYFRECRSREEATRDSIGLLHGTSTPIVNLRNGELNPTDRLRRVRKPLVTAGAAAIFLLLCVGAVFQWRTEVYGRLADDVHQELRLVFQQALPDESMPVGVRRRLKNHLLELQRIHGSEVRDDVLSRRTDGFQLLNDLLRGLPSEMRFTVLDLRLDESEFTLHGQARSHGDADRIASALRNSESLFVNEPRTQTLRTGQGVSFTLDGYLLSSSAQSAVLSMSATSGGGSNSGDGGTSGGGATSGGGGVR